MVADVQVEFSQLTRRVCAKPRGILFWKRIELWVEEFYWMGPALGYQPRPEPTPTRWRRAREGDLASLQIPPLMVNLEIVRRM